MDSFLQELEDFLLEEERAELDVKVDDEGAPVIDSDQKANYFIKLCNKIQREIDRTNELCKEEVSKTTQRIERFKDESIKPLNNQLAYYHRLLKNYTEYAVSDTKKKSVKLPDGVLQLKKQQPSWDYQDIDAIIEWAEGNQSKLVITESTKKIDKTALKKAAILDLDNNIATIDGVSIPGIVVTNNEDAFLLKYNK